MKYIKGSWLRNHVMPGIAAAIFLLLIQLILPVSADEGITAYCYRDQRSLGNVIVFDTATAAASCNSLYYECRGKCIGCFYDSDYIAYVCVDISGRTFLR